MCSPVQFVLLSLYLFYRVIQFFPHNIQNIMKDSKEVLSEVYRKVNTYEKEKDLTTPNFVYQGTRKTIEPHVHKRSES